MEIDTAIELLRASMRPRLNAGENKLLDKLQGLRFGASMRPRLNAGENRPRCGACMVRHPVVDFEG